MDSLTGSTINSLTSINDNKVVAVPQKKEEKTTYKRSTDRCNILCRTPVYDRKGDLLCYTFRYTAGSSSFRPDMLEKKHVKHIITGFYTRRHSELFTQTNGFCLSEFPLTPELNRYAKQLPATKFILHLQDRQEATASYKHQVSMLKKESMSIAADVYTIVYTNWYTELRSINYAIIDMTKDIEEQFILARNIQKKASWIKIICDRCDNLNKASIAFESGADYVCCPLFNKGVLKAKFNPAHYKVNQSSYDSIMAVLAELIEPRPNYDLFFGMLKKNSSFNVFIAPVLNYLEQGKEHEYYFDALEDCIYDMDVEVLSKLISIVVLMMLEEFYRQDKDKNNYRFVSFEPVRQILLKAKFIEELSYYRAQNVDTSFSFAIGICADLNMLYPYTTQLTQKLLMGIDSRLNELFSENDEYKVLHDISTSMESLNLEYVDGIMMSNFISRHDILNAYENSVMWIAGLTDICAKIKKV